MIKLFRHIRQSLLSEGKISKYFKYAIGEIVLVVIGILIALQINNWNENKKQKAELNGYLNNISKNIQSDIIDLNVIKSFRDSSKLGAQQFIKLANQKAITIDEFNEYTSTFLFKYNSLFDVYFKSDKSGFEALKNSGYLNKIQGKEIETELYNYYNLVTDIEQEEQSLNNFIEEMEYDMFKSDVVLQFITAIKDIRNNPTENNLKKAHQLMNFPSFKGANFRVSSLRTILKSYETIDTAAKKVMSSIENIK